MMSMRPSPNISDYLQRALMRYQAAKGVQPDAAHDPSHSIPLFSIKRTAWTKFYVSIYKQYIYVFKSSLF
uniref:Uncharacterized protein n=1 Tax=Heterorhabditis bacteriophora TaxID=37862 RepID=A0A1I7X5H6_HETBA